MAWTALSSVFVYKMLLTYQRMDQIGENLDLCIRTDLGGQTITSASAVTAFSISQGYDVTGLFINSEATTEGQYGLDIRAKYCQSNTQDLSGGRGLRIYRNLNEAGSRSLILFNEDHASSTQPIVEIDNDGSGEEIKFTHAVTRYKTIPGAAFTGYIDSSDTVKNIDAAGNLTSLENGATTRIFYAPVTGLPDGATITGMRLFYYQVDNAAVLNVLLQRLDMQGTAGTELATCDDQNIATAWGTDDDTANEVVDHSQYSYNIAVTIENNDAISEIWLGGIRITYTITEPLP